MGRRSFVGVVYKRELDMKITRKTLLALFFYVLGVVGWCYVGGWMILTRPVKGLIMAHLSGSFSIGKVFVALIQTFIYLSLAGGVWCVGYMLSDHFRDEE